MLYYVNVILYNFLYRKQLLVEVNKHLIYRSCLTIQLVPWTFGKFWKQTLGLVLMLIRTCISVRQKEMLCLNA